MIVYLDMDGVVSNFEQHVKDLFDVYMDEMSPEQKSRFWARDVVTYDFFANSPLIEAGYAFLSRLLDNDVSVMFLSSTGGQPHHNTVAIQKLRFLGKHGMGHLPVSFATGTKGKAALAHSRAILVDDRDKVVNAFTEAGGHAFLFTEETADDVFENVMQLVRGERLKASP